LDVRRFKRSQNQRICTFYDENCEAGFPQLTLIQSVDVLALTILISSCLAGIFICCFAAEYRRCRNKSLERDSLLPLNDVPTPVKRQTEIY
jgi:hypothetical protein